MTSAKLSVHPAGAFTYAPLLNFHSEPYPVSTDSIPILKNGWEVQFFIRDPVTCTRKLPSRGGAQVSLTATVMTSHF